MFQKDDIANFKKQLNFPSMNRRGILEFMRKYLRNLWYFKGDQRLSPFVHLFLYLTFVFGLSFAIFPVASGASLTLLYQLSTIHFASVVANIWGWAAIVVTFLNTLAYATRNKLLSSTVTMLGFSLWAYAALIYAMGGFWFGVLVIVPPHLFYWGWQYTQVSKYHREKVFSRQNNIELHPERYELIPDLRAGNS